MTKNDGDHCDYKDDPLLCTAVLYSITNTGTSISVDSSHFSFAHA